MASPLDFCFQFPRLTVFNTDESGQILYLTNRPIILMPLVQSVMCRGAADNFFINVFSAIFSNVHTVCVQLIHKLKQYNLLAPLIILCTEIHCQTDTDTVWDTALIVMGYSLGRDQYILSIGRW